MTKRKEKQKEKRIGKKFSWQAGDITITKTNKGKSNQEETNRDA